MRILILAAALILTTAPLRAQTDTPQKAAKMLQGKGSFDVKTAPTDHVAAPDTTTFSLDKSYHGDLEGTGKGEMLTAGDYKTGNAGYVAIERINGRLNGHDGTFAVIHTGIMATGIEPKMSVTIVPGSGTGELSGIYGSMTITNTAGKHSFTIDYAFAGK